ncbi:hypothetical protein PV10_01561 [Exophiala mesophila]|uniref:Uncharacterized protein n=1 Tax=Exophiala mesophila TaxID=212818 RepID=A0A0D1ZTE0_EXOME|nr:uncharacterized protein PV10_01561 [Exophiala mesophila]KIV97857.1 hypothetical protein PV10_01561 [Exophiala mesophila]
MYRLKSALLGNNVPTDPMPVVAEGELAPPESLLPTTGLPQDRAPSPVPSWVREINNTPIGRHSRASSIISTHTKFSTTTLQDDARSINITVAGQYFRINRDGSRVTVDAPPPYSGPSQAGSVEVVALDNLSLSDRGQSIQTDDLDLEDVSRTPRSIVDVSLDDDFFSRLRGVEQSVSPPRPENSIHRSSSLATISHVSDIALASTEEGASIDDDNRDGRSVLQHPFNTVVNLPAGDDFARGGSPTSQNSGSWHRTWAMGTSTTGPTSSDSCGHVPLLQRIGLSRSVSRAQSNAPSMQGSQEELAQPSPDTLHQSQPPISIAVSAPADNESQSPDQPEGDPSPSDEPKLGIHRQMSQMSVETENEMMMHYTKMMRKLDYEHRKALHLKDKELADMRVRLHEKDTVLRQQVRAKDFMIDDLKQRLNAFEENIESMLERARNQVEDMWESRWKDRDFHLRERMKRIEEEAQRSIDKLRTDIASPATKV